MSTTLAVSYNDGFAEKWINYLSPAEWRNKVDVEFRTVPLAKLKHAGCHTDPAVISGWIRTMKNGDSVPPPVAVETECGSYYLHDGNHRLEALQEFFDNDPDAQIRIAVAVPRTGYEFVLRSMGDYSTYMLAPVFQPVAAAIRYASVVGASALALALSAIVPGANEAFVFVFLLQAVIFACWVAGWKGGILGTSAGMAGAAYFRLPPVRSLLIEGSPQFMQFLIAGIAMGATILLVAFMRAHPTIELRVPGTKLPQPAKASAAEAGRM